jgi:predicted ATPase
LIDLLTKKGFQTVPEAARLVIQGEMTDEGKDHPIQTDAASLQHKIKDAQLGFESRLQAKDLLFLDGAIPGSLAYFRVFGLNPNEILEECFYHRYASVFILDPLPFQLDDERIEDIAPVQGYLHEWHTRDYIALGYPVIKVPVISPEDRLGFVLDSLVELGLM